MSVYVPESWLPTGFESLHDYLKTEINNAVLDNNGNPVGLEVYEVVMDAPASADLPKPAEFGKTIIHLAVDDLSNVKIGFGENKTLAEYDDVNNLVTEYEAGQHMLNFDVGVWASDVSGGSSARLRAYQMLFNALGTEIAKRKCYEATQGVEIVSYNGGRFVIERVSDVRTYRIVGAELVVRLFSKTADSSDVITGEVVQEPDLEIDGTPLTD